MHDPDSITNLSTTAIVFLLVFVPGISLLVLIGLSYAFSPWGSGAG
jgi:hypothetical protein